MSASNPLAGLTPEQQAVAIEQGAKALFESDLGIYLGPWLLGFTFDFALFGVMCHQLVHWLSLTSNERPFTRILLAWSVTASAASSFFALALIFHLFVYHFGTYSNFLTMQLVGWYTILIPLVILPAQLFYIERAYRINKNKIWIPIVGVALALGSVAGGIGGKIVVVRFSFAQLSGVRPYFWVWFGFTFACDSFLTGMILFGLWRSRTGWSQTDWLLNRLLRISVEAQLPATLLALALMITYSVKPDSFVLVFWEMWHPKTYVCALIAVLNAKFSLRADFASGGDDFSNSDKNAQNVYLHSERLHQDTVDIRDPDRSTESYEMPTLRIPLNRQQPPLTSDTQSDIVRGGEREWDSDNVRENG
ncbi:hypothetical protein BCR39DRAFT_505532 [Naematelia encephala]|uniref:DUF6534 domain-containing protein n=1 Tax=Naematelia encephala TaxID=71784 RepID=A0A1Y2B4T8_9TREE|nr:hypothetical protein BCR39DRAFT_505532 [Naematelia encephala]